MTGKEMAAAVADLVRRGIAQATTALADRIDALESSVASIPAGPKGDPGDRGEKGDPGDGRDGRDGDIGPRGPAGDSVSLSDVIMAMQPQIKSFLDSIPAPKPPPLADVVAGLEPAIESAYAKWALEFERRAQDTLQRAVERMPKPADGQDGKDGADGMGFDDLTVEHDGERGFTIKLQQGDRVKSFSFSVPVVIDRGFWKEGTAVAKGDGMTFGGSYWIAQNETKAKPETGCADWRLAIRKGRDGK